MTEKGKPLERSEQLTSSDMSNAGSGQNESNVSLINLDNNVILLVLNVPIQSSVLIVQRNQVPVAGTESTTAFSSTAQSIESTTILAENKFVMCTPEARISEKNLSSRDRLTKRPVKRRLSFRDKSVISNESGAHMETETFTKKRKIENLCPESVELPENSAVQRSVTSKDVEAQRFDSPSSTVRLVSESNNSPQLLVKNTSQSKIANSGPEVNNFLIVNNKPGLMKRSVSDSELVTEGRYGSSAIAQQLSGIDILEHYTTFDVAFDYQREESTEKAPEQVTNLSSNEEMMISDDEGDAELNFSASNKLNLKQNNFDNISTAEQLENDQTKNFIDRISDDSYLGKFRIIKDSLVLYKRMRMITSSEESDSDEGNDRTSAEVSHSNDRTSTEASNPVAKQLECENFTDFCINLAKYRIQRSENGKRHSTIKIADDTAIHSFVKTKTSTLAPTEEFYLNGEYNRTSSKESDWNDSNGNERSSLKTEENKYDTLRIQSAGLLNVKKKRSAQKAVDKFGKFVSKQASNIRVNQRKKNKTKFVRKISYFRQRQTTSAGAFVVSNLLK